MEHKTLKIPELETALEVAAKTLWTDEIDCVIRNYYPKFARVRSVDKLREYINAKYNRSFSYNSAITKRYALVKEDK